MNQPGEDGSNRTIPQAKTYFINVSVASSKFALRELTKVIFCQSFQLMKNSWLTMVAVGVMEGKTERKVRIKNWKRKKGRVGECQTVTVLLGKNDSNEPTGDGEVRKTGASNESEKNSRRRRSIKTVRLCTGWLAMVEIGSYPAEIP